MAIFYSAIFASVRNKLANTVLYKRGKDGIIRTKPDKIRNPRTRAQMVQRVKVAFVGDIARRLAPVITEGFKSKPANMTVYNMFMKKNIHLVTVSEEMEPTMDMEQLVCAQGILQRPKVTLTGSGKNVTAKVEEQKENALAAGDDQVYLAMFEEEQKESVLVDLGLRSAHEEMTAEMPDNWNPEMTHFYVFAVSKSGRRTSDSFVLDRGAKTV